MAPKTRGKVQKKAVPKRVTRSSSRPNEAEQEEPVIQQRPEAAIVQVNTSTGPTPHAGGENNMTAFVTQQLMAAVSVKNYLR